MVSSELKNTYIANSTTSNIRSHVSSRRARLCAGGYRGILLRYLHPLLPGLCQRIPESLYGLNHTVGGNRTGQERNQSRQPQTSRRLEGQEPPAPRPLAISG